MNFCQINWDKREIKNTNNEDGTLKANSVFWTLLLRFENHDFHWNPKWTVIGQDGQKMIGTISK